MTPNEHYAEAEILLEVDSRDALLAANVHATLATAGYLKVANQIMARIWDGPSG